ncbi:N-acetylneuraminate synthase family protein [Leptospira sp. GIMC2001]|uniref:N-acetylneuraminate synthase family protein n=1 Tax=Leptospira sp. GIMC2001 TaxID=1513297 RepID=UPI00234964C0|nr:N-acetylneuraminate synthase family protein [Leptospira sp. GIMC2001]WCL48617.1 N-acetylneuraminate synthase family protein [Leptospira sp. GIMC2001]
MFQECIELTEDLIISREDPPFLIAEIGLNHNNDLEIGKRTIEAAAKAGAQAVKFQTYNTQNFIDSTQDRAKFLFDIFKKYELNEKFHREFQKTANDNGLIFFSTPLDSESVDLLVNLEVPALKIASGDIVNSELLEKVASSKLPIFLSTGASNLSEVIRALEFLKDRDVESLCLMHCVSLYPAPSESLNLNTLQIYKDLTDGPLGFSDHSAGFLGASIAVSMDATVIEKHFTLDKKADGPDHSISADPKDLKDLSDNIKLAYSMKGKKSKILHPKEAESYFFGRRSLYTDANGIVRAMRPNLHLEDNNIGDSWDYTFIEEDKRKNSKHSGQILPFRRGDFE